MFRVVTFLSILACWGLPSTAQSQVPESAKAVVERYEASIEELSQEYRSSLETAKQRNREQLGQLIEKFKKAGDLDSVLSLEEELTKVAQSDSSIAGKPPVAATVARRGFEDALRKADADFKKKARLKMELLLKELTELEKSETKADRIASAKEIRDFRLEREKAGPAKPTVMGVSPSDDSVGEWVDLLKWNAGFDWAPRGINWNANLAEPPTQRSLKFKAVPGDGVNYPLPAIVEGDYELVAEFTRLSGQEDVGLNLPVGIYNVTVAFSSLGQFDGIGAVDGRWLIDSESSRKPSRIQTGKRHRVRVVVNRNAGQANITIDLDDTPNYITWIGPESTLRSTRSYMTMLFHPGVNVTRTVAEFHSVRIRMLSGTIEHDVLTDKDRTRDLKQGYVRLVGQPPINPSAQWGKYLVTQMPSLFGGELYWPMIAREFSECTDFYGVRAPSRLRCSVPSGAKSFSIIGTNEESKAAHFQILLDGVPVFDSGITPVAIIKLDLQPGSKVLELVLDPAGNEQFDRCYWCYPRFHGVTVDEIKDKMLDGTPGPLKVVIDQVSNGTLKHNTLLENVKSVPVHFRDVVPCNEFLWAHTPSAVAYQIPKGMSRFTAIGHCMFSHHVKFEVWADGKMIFQSPQAGIAKIDVKLPVTAQLLELKVIDLGDSDHDVCFWCYPRLYRK